LPNPRTDLNIELHIIDRLLVDDLKKSLTVKEPVIVTAGTGMVVGVVTSVKGDIIRFMLKSPVVVEEDQKVSLSRRSINGWRLYGYGFIRK